MRVCMCGYVCVCVCMFLYVCVCVSMRVGLDGWLVAGQINSTFGMGLGFRLEDATVAVVANLDFETSFYG